MCIYTEVKLPNERVKGNEIKAKGTSEHYVFVIF